METRAPSGCEFIPYDFELARQLHGVGFVRWSDQPFMLKSGQSSQLYVFGRDDLTDNPGVLREVGKAVARHAYEIKDRLNDRRKICLIGVPTAGTPIATAASLCAPHTGNRSIVSRVMREAVKNYGAHKGVWVNGRPNPEEHLYCTVDNVITDGKSKLETIARLQEDGYSVEEMHHIILVDRQQGGVRRLEELGVRVSVVFKLLDLVWAFGQLNLWPPGRVWAAEEEIAGHQV